MKLLEIGIIGLIIFLFIEFLEINQTLNYFMKKLKNFSILKRIE
jgi:hypothetical protein